MLPDEMSVRRLTILVGMKQRAAHPIYPKWRINSPTKDNA